MEQPVGIFVLGRPGAGKDTQAALLGDFFHLQNVKTSTLLRSKFEHEADDPRVAEQKRVFDAGELNDPEWVISVVREHIDALFDGNLDGANGVIFSGSPRTLHEAQTLVPFLAERLGEGRLLALHIAIDEEEGIARILKRNARELDRDEDILRTRMREFAEETQPAIQYLQERGLLETVDGSPSPQEVFEAAQHIVRERFHIEDGSD